MFEAFYLSFWQHPLLLWLVPAGFAVYLRMLPPANKSLRRSLWLFTGLSLLDPLITGPLCQMPGFPDGVAQALMLLFVLLGDLRFFYFIERWGHPASVSRQHLSFRLLGLTLTIPLLQGALVRLLPGVFSSARHTFLAYELLFFLLTLVFYFGLLPRRALSPELLKWSRGLCLYAGAYYFLWASADCVILLGFDFGYLLRVIPNLMYYGLFLPFVLISTPPSLKQSLKEA